MGSRKSPSGPLSALSGFITIGETAIGSATAITSVTAIARVAIGPAGTATANMNGKIMSTNDVVSVSPRIGTIGTTPNVPVAIAYARVVSVESATVSTAVGIIQLGLYPTTTASSTAQANTFDISVALRSADL